jgi:Ran GTPase-activating protein 1
LQINLNDNAFGLNTQAPLVAFLSSHVPLQHLILNNNGLGPHAGILIADALTALHAKKVEARKAGEEVPDLETVICGRNRLENGSMTAWAKAYSLHSGVNFSFDYHYTNLLYSENLLLTSTLRRSKR